jgi:hypothetical protein
MKKIGTIAMILIGIIMLIIASSCSAFKHIVPEQGNFFVTKNDTCKRQFVTIGYKQDIFGSVVKLNYRSPDDSINLKLFRVTSNSYSGEYNGKLYHVSFGIEQILKIENTNTIIVDYRCH